MKHALATAAAVAALAAGPPAKTLTVYFIDVEGGQSTLLVTAAGQSLLVDTGYPGREGRDPDRIMAAARDAGVAQIDYLLITHLHEDHVGGAAELARRMPIGTFVDYGSPIETGADVADAFSAYEEARRRGRHIVPKPGDRLPLTGLDVEVVAADGAALAKPLAGAGQANAACTGLVRRAENRNENPRSIGVRVRYGAFRFVDLGDLVWNQLADLVCPANLLGEAEVYLVAHHANGDSNVPAVLSALRPRVAIVNNGPYKGAVAAALATLHGFPDTDVWQLHRTFNDGAENFPAAFVVNPDVGERDTAAWIKITASATGAFSVTNGATGWTKQYSAGAQGRVN